MTTAVRMCMQGLDAHAPHTKSRASCCWVDARAVPLEAMYPEFQHIVHRYGTWVRAHQCVHVFRVACGAQLLPAISNHKGLQFDDARDHGVRRRPHPINPPTQPNEEKRALAVGPTQPGTADGPPPSTTAPRGCVTGRKLPMTCAILPMHAHCALPAVA